MRNDIMHINFKHQHNLTMPCFLPIINSMATAHLTPAELHSTHIVSGSLDLPQLYLKPGITCLSKFYQNAINFYQWSGITILNAKNDRLAQFKVNSDTFKIHSPYDGSNIKFDAKQVLDLATLFKVDCCVLPSFLGDNENSLKLLELNRRNLLSALNSYSGNIPLFVEYDLTHQQAVCEHSLIKGYVYSANNYLWTNFVTDLTVTSAACAQYLHLVTGDLNWQQILQVIVAGADCVQSDQPATDGAKGMLYNASGNFDIADDSCEMQFKAIDDNCKCYCCSHFTIAYLHHLFKNNVLLGIKLQVLHNLYFVTDMITKLRDYAAKGRLREFENKYMMSP